jgi:hypothetical protein
MYGLRRDGENKNTFESKAAQTGAKIALVTGLFKLCCFIFLFALWCFLKFVQSIALIFIYARKNCINNTFNAKFT